MDWQTLISELLESGLTQPEIAKMADCSQSLISELFTRKKGKRLSYRIGSKLVAIHRKRCPAPLEKALS